MEDAQQDPLLSSAAAGLCPRAPCTQGSCSPQWAGNQTQGPGGCLAPTQLPMSPQNSAPWFQVPSAPHTRGQQPSEGPRLWGGSQPLLQGWHESRLVEAPRFLQRTGRRPLFLPGLPLVPKAPGQSRNPPSGSAGRVLECISLTSRPCQPGTASQLRPRTQPGLGAAAFAALLPLGLSLSSPCP